MFTGLVQAIGTVAAVRPLSGPTPGGGGKSGGGVHLLINPGNWTHRPTLGESISISGCCLTLAEETESTRGQLAFNAIPETLAKTTLGALRAGSTVNLERSLMASDLMGGHLVHGHIDGVGTFERVDTGDDWRITVRPPPDLMPYIVPKGSICIDGISLTIAAVDPKAGTFGVALIPTTLELTTLGRAKTGDQCNLEADMMAKTIVHYLRHFGPTGPSA